MRDMLSSALTRQMARWHLAKLKFRRADWHCI